MPMQGVESRTVPILFELTTDLVVYPFRLGLSSSHQPMHIISTSWTFDLILKMPNFEV